MFLFFFIVLIFLDLFRRFLFFFLSLFGYFSFIERACCACRTWYLVPGIQYDERGVALSALLYCKTMYQYL